MNPLAVERTASGYAVVDLTYTDRGFRPAVIATYATEQDAEAIARSLNDERNQEMASRREHERNEPRSRRGKRVQARPGRTFPAED